MEPKRDDKMEQLLRRWGADEAASGVEVPEMQGIGPRRSVGRRLARWGVLASAAAVLLVVCAFAVSQFLQMSDNVPPPKPAVPDAGGTGFAQRSPEIDKLQTQVEQLQEKNTLLGTQLAEARASAEAAKDLEAKLAAAQAELDAARKRLAQQGTVDADALKKQLAAEKLAAAELEKNLADCRRTVKQLEEKVTALTAGRAKLVEQLAALQKGESTRLMWMLLTAQRAYLGGRPSLARRKAAVVGNKLTCRVAEVKPKADPVVRGERPPAIKDARQEVVRLVDQLEVVLTLLDLLEANDPEKVSEFRKLVEQSDYVRRIDAAMLQPGVDADLAVWLFEVKLVLLGV
ncbi:MAG: hypothetical protein ACOCXX_01275 [Planctomycetota bacterium]